MSELNVYHHESRPNEYDEFYLKSEADKVIAEKDAEIARLNAIRKVHVEAIESMGAGLLQDEEENRHSKYKRCLAMADWCEATALWCYQAANTLPAGFHATLHGKPVMIEPARLFKRSALLAKWNTRWLELAEKFKHKEDK